MVVAWQSHAQFQQFLLSQFSQRYGSMEKQKILNFYQSTLAKVWLTDLSPAVPILEPCYASTRRGKAPRDPLAMLRTFMVMSLEGNVNITQWVRSLRSRPLLAILCGFEPNKTPGVGTFCFIDRLWLAPRHTKSRQKPFVPKPRRRGKRNEKLETPKHPGSVERLVNRIAKYQDAPPPPAPFDVVMNLFKHCFVLPSAHFGLLMEKARKLYPDFFFSELSLDAAHDAYPIDCLLDSWNISPIIAANSRINPHPEHEKFHLTATGIPLCHCGMSTVYNGLNFKRRRTKWCCPVAAGKFAKCLKPETLFLLIVWPGFLYHF